VSVVAAVISRGLCVLIVPVVDILFSLLIGFVLRIDVSNSRRFPGICSDTSGRYLDVPDTLDGTCLCSGRAAGFGPIPKSWLDGFEGNKTAAGVGFPLCSSCILDICMSDLLFFTCKGALEVASGGFGPCAAEDLLRDLSSLVSVYGRGAEA